MGSSCCGGRMIGCLQDQRIGLAASVRRVPSGSRRHPARLCSRTRKSRGSAGARGCKVFHYDACSYDHRVRGSFAWSEGCTMMSLTTHSACANHGVSLTTGRVQLAEHEVTEGANMSTGGALRPSKAGDFDLSKCGRSNEHSMGGNPRP